MRIVVRAVPAAALLAAALLAAALLTGCGSSHGSDHASSSPAPTAGTTSAVASPADASTSGDIAFAQMMIPHHQQAVEMADMALATSTSTEVRGLAEEIKAAQAPEIQQMQQWLAQWGAGESTADGGHGDHGDMTSGEMDHGDAGMAMGDMPGMMSDEQMAQLMDATGPAFDRMWLEMMIAHHEGAITMAKDVQATSTRPEVLALAVAIIKAQEAEIAQMKGLLAEAQ